MSVARVVADPSRLFEALEATWPPAGGALAGPFRLRRGGGGGQRVSAAVWNEDLGPVDVCRARAGLAEAEAQMVAWEQRPLFMVRGRPEDGLDEILTDLGYAMSDPSLLLTVPAAQFAQQKLAPLRAILADPKLQICREIWRSGGIGPPRQAVIGRIPRPSCALLGRHGDVPVGAAVVALDGPVAMLHALHVLPAHRNEGIARDLLVRAGQWAQARGCAILALAVVAANRPARHLFESLGFRRSADYHYRVAPAPVS